MKGEGAHGGGALLSAQYDRRQRMASHAAAPAPPPSPTAHRAAGLYKNLVALAPPNKAAIKAKFYAVPQIRKCKCL